MEHSQTDSTSINWYNHKSIPKYIPKRSTYICIPEDILNSNTLGLGKE